MDAFDELLAPDKGDKEETVSADKLSVSDLPDELLVFSFVSVQHGFTDSACYFFFVEADDASIPFDDCLYHMPKLYIIDE